MTNDIKDNLELIEQPFDVVPWLNDMRIDSRRSIYPSSSSGSSFKVGSFSISSTWTQEITVGFEPKLVIVKSETNRTIVDGACAFEEGGSNTYLQYSTVMDGHVDPSLSQRSTDEIINDMQSTEAHISAKSSTSFTINCTAKNNSANCFYIAIG